MMGTVLYHTHINVKGVSLVHFLKLIILLG